MALPLYPRIALWFRNRRTCRRSGNWSTRHCCGGPTCRSRRRIFRFQRSRRLARKARSSPVSRCLPANRNRGWRAVRPLRQQELTTARDSNQIQVDVMNGVIALQQATGRYQTAVQNRILQEKLLDAEQKKFQAGESTSFNVIQQQRDLSTAQAQEVTT